MRAFVISVALFAAGAGLGQAKERDCISSTDANPAALTWLSGEWTHRSPGSEAHQYWTGPQNGILIGHEVVAINGATSFAFLRIARGSQGLTLFVSLNGADPFELKAVELCNTQIVFEGNAGAYPHRIVYSNTLMHVAAAAPEERQFHPKPAMPFL